MLSTILRTLSLKATLSWIVLGGGLCACSPGGGSSGSGPVSLSDVVYFSSPRKMILVQKAAAFRPGELMPTLWIDVRDATVDMTSSTAISSDRAWLVTPELPSGLYSVVIDLGPINGSLTVQVQEPPQVADPHAFLQETHDAQIGGLLETRAIVEEIIDIDLSASLLRNLSAAEDAMSRVTDLLRSASAEEINEAANFIAANQELLGSSAALGGIGTPRLGGHEFDEEAALSEVAERLSLSDVKIATGLAMIAFGVAVLIPQPIAGGLLIAAGLSVASRGFVEASRAKSIPIVVIQSSFSFDVSVDKIAERSGLVLQAYVTYPVRFQAQAESLNRTLSSDSAIRLLLATWDKMADAVSNASAEIRFYLSSDLPDLVSPSAVQQVDLSPLQILATSSNWRTPVGFSRDGVMFFLDGLNTESTSLTFHYTSTLPSGLGSSTSTLACTVKPSPCAFADPSIPFFLTAGEISANAHILSLDDESEERGTTYNTMRLGEGDDDEFHVDLASSGAGFWIYDNVCHTVSSPTFGQTHDGVSRISITPNALISQFGCYFWDSSIFGTYWTMTAFDCFGRTASFEIDALPCGCGNPTCDLADKFYGFIFSAPVASISIDFKHGVYSFLTFDNFAFTEWVPEKSD